MLRRARHDVAARLGRDQRLPDLRLTEVVLRPDHTDHGWAWHALGHLTDQRGRANACHATVITSHPHPSMAGAIDAVRELARHWHASRPDPGDPATLLRLAAPPVALTGTALDPGWAVEVADQAARLRMRLAEPDTTTGQPAAAPAPTPSP